MYQEDVTIQIFMYLEIEIYETKVKRTAGNTDNSKVTRN